MLAVELAATTVTVAKAMTVWFPMTAAGGSTSSECDGPWYRSGPGGGGSGGSSDYATAALAAADASGAIATTGLGPVTTLTARAAEAAAFTVTRGCLRDESVAAAAAAAAEAAVAAKAVTPVIPVTAASGAASDSSDSEGRRDPVGNSGGWGGSSGVSCECLHDGSGAAVPALTVVVVMVSITAAALVAATNISDCMRVCDCSNVGGGGIGGDSNDHCRRLHQHHRWWP